MSSIDETKESKELSCFHNVLELGIKKNNKTSEILQYLNGEVLKRKKNDRPDLICRCTKRVMPHVQTIVGIEHFQVNQLSQEKGEKIVSTGAEYESHIAKVYKKGHAEIEESGVISDENNEKLMHEVSGFVGEMLYSGYYSFLEAFKHHLTHHLEQVQDYRNNISIIANQNPIEMALLIDMRMIFPDLFLNQGERVTVVKNGLLPICEEVVLELEKIDKRLVNYVILYSSNILEDAEDVIALQTGNIREQLRDQKITVYEYVGEELSNNNFIDVNPSYCKEENGDYTIMLQINNPFELQNNCMKVAMQAARAKKNGRPFVTTKRIQCFLKYMGIV